MAYWTLRGVSCLLDCIAHLRACGTVSPFRSNLTQSPDGAALQMPLTECVIGLYCSAQPSCATQSVEISRISPGGTIFSLCQLNDRSSLDTVGTPGSIIKEKRLQPIFCGTSNKDVVTWAPTENGVSDKVHLKEHTGWVRALSTSGKWLFSCGCNYLRVWDTTWPVPREVDQAKLFTGDILDVASTSNTREQRVFACTAKGSLHSWVVDKVGKLGQAAVREKAHADRITAIVHHKNFLFSASYDGYIRAWNAETLELVMEMPAAHAGSRVLCLAIGPDGLLYSGGEDKLIRRWSTAELQPVAEPVYGHQHPIKVLAAGGKELVLSADAGGEVCVWYV